MYAPHQQMYTNGGIGGGGMPQHSNLEHAMNSMHLNHQQQQYIDQQMQSQQGGYGGNYGGIAVECVSMKNASLQIHIGT